MFSLKELTLWKKKSQYKECRFYEMDIINIYHKLL